MNLTFKVCIQIFSKDFHNLDQQKFLNLVCKGYVQLVLLNMAGLRVGRVKIYNVKRVKTEVALGPLKLCRNQKSFWVLSNQPPGLCLAGSDFFVEKKMEF